jgi:hypothetical protein
LQAKQRDSFGLFARTGGCWACFRGGQGPTISYSALGVIQDGVAIRAFEAGHLMGVDASDDRQSDCVRCLYWLDAVNEQTTFREAFERAEHSLPDASLVR